MNLIEIFKKEKFNTDKYNLGYITEFYNNFLNDFKSNPINFLEIGVSKCGSINLWKKFFHEKSLIFAGDIKVSNNCPKEINFILGNCYSKEIINGFNDDFFDLIIDDGPHTFSSFKILIEEYFCKLKKDGYLIIEDILKKEWLEPLVDLAKKTGYEKCDVVDMTNKQQTDFLLDRWKNGLFILKLQK